MRECFRGLINFSGCPVTKFMPFFGNLLKENGIMEIKYTQIAFKRGEVYVYFEAFIEETYMYFFADENFAKLITTWWNNNSKANQFGEDFVFEINYIDKCPKQNELYSTFCRFCTTDNICHIGYHIICLKDIKTVADWNKTWGKYHLSLAHQNNLQN